MSGYDPHDIWERERQERWYKEADRVDPIQDELDLESEKAMRNVTVIDPDNNQKLTKLWAIVSRDEKGFEGIVGSEIGQWITGSEKNKAMFLTMAKEASLLTKKKLWLVEFVPNGEAKEI